MLGVILKVKLQNNITAIINTAYHSRVEHRPSASCGSASCRREILRFVFARALTVACAPPCVRRQDFSVPYPYAPCLVAHPDVLAAQPDVVSAFLRASAEGWRAAAASPADAARALIKLAAEDSSAQLDAAVVEDSAAFVAGRCLDPAGRWGVMEAAKWDEYIDWLVDSGLLTTALQSRHPDAAADRVSLDDLREGWAGDPIARDAVPTVFTNDFLPMGNT